MRNKWAQRLIFATGMLGIAGPGMVDALDEYKMAKVLVQIVCGLALAFTVQSRTQHAEQNQDESPKSPL